MMLGIFEEVVLGSVQRFQVIGGKCWVDLAVEWRGVLLEVWVRLGDEF